MGLGAPYVGTYEVTGGAEPQRIGISLIASRESSMESVEKLNFPEVTVSATETVVKTDEPLWGWFAFAGLGLLIVEWWYFQKKPAGIPG
jgi:hypothetical protein